MSTLNNGQLYCFVHIVLCVGDVNMSSCIVHYQGYDDTELLPLSKFNYDRLKHAKQCRVELGGENVHTPQSCNIPDTFIENKFYHLKCYKKYTHAISRSTKRKAAASSETALLRTLVRVSISRTTSFILLKVSTLFLF